MIRNALAVLSGLLLVSVAVTAVLAVYDLASIYGDPTGSELAFFGAFAPVGAIVLVLMIAVAAATAALAHGRVRRILALFATGVVALTIPAIVVANHYGHEDKREDTAVPPTCGIRNPALDAEFRRLDHPGYFGGGSASRVGCSYLLDAEDADAALTAYEKRLAGLGYEVRRDADGVEAAAEDFQFHIRVRSGVEGADRLTVTLRERTEPSPGSVIGSG